MQDHSLEAEAARVMADLLAASHLLPPDAVDGALAAAARPLGVRQAQVYLADLQQRELILLATGGGPAGGALAIDSTLAGRAYRDVKLHHVPAPDGDGYRVWVPMVDGTERLGVLELLVQEVDEARLAHLRRLGSLAGLIIASKSRYGDSYARTERSQPMSLQAELVWSLLPPRTIATGRVLVAAALEPAYEVGGDAFDYSLTGDRLQVSIFDSVGHDLAAGLLASVAIASCRSTRRAGGALPDIAARADHDLARQFGGSRFVTAVLGDLDTRTGQLRWIPCGHPPPLLIRDNRVVKQLTRKPRPPLGLDGLAGRPRRAADGGDPPGAQPSPVYTEQLEAGDRVLLYTDGVTDGRAADGTPFGVDRFSDFIIRNSNEGTPVPETLRRLNQAITEYQQDRLYDDATIVLIEWMPGRPAQQLIP
jgi:serine phosphatase RsbU (regulator of sigma subunit)